MFIFNVFVTIFKILWKKYIVILAFLPFLILFKGLARSLETANWDFTCRLASRYNVDPWIVTATHMEAVLVETEDAQAIKDIIQKQES